MSECATACWCMLIEMSDRTNSEDTKSECGSHSSRGRGGGKARQACPINLQLKAILGQTQDPSGTVPCRTKHLAQLTFPARGLSGGPGAKYCKLAAAVCRIRQWVVPVLQDKFLQCQEPDTANVATVYKHPVRSRNITMLLVGSSIKLLTVSYYLYRYCSSR